MQVGLDESGRQKRVYITGKRKQAVLDRLVELRSERGKGASARPTFLKVYEYLINWLENYKRPTIREGTYQNYRGLINNKMRPYIGGYRLVDLTPAHIQVMFTSLERAGESPDRRSQAHAVLYSALRSAVKQGLRSTNPCEAVPSVRLPSREIRVLDELQSHDLLSAARSSRLYAIYVLAIAIGMREGELFGLKWSDVNWETNTISVKRTVANAIPKGLSPEEAAAARTNAPKTRKSRRNILLPAVVSSILRDHQARMTAEGFLQWVFTSVRGKLLRRDNFNKRDWKPLLEKANAQLPPGRQLPADLEFRELRHSAATFRVSQGDHPKVVQELLGHARIGITMDVYSHVMPTLQSESAEKLNATMKRLVEPGSD